MTTQLMTVKRRNALFNEMDEATQAVAIAGLEKLQKGFKADLLVRYDIGELINQVFAAEHLDATQKKDELDKLADYWGQSSLALYDLRNVALAFSREFLAEQVHESMSNGQYLTFTHFRELQKIKESKRLLVLQQVRQHCWSAKELALELQGSGSAQHSRAGGRAPSVPKTPTGMLQKIFTTVQQTDNYLTAVQEPLEAMYAGVEKDSKFIENLNSTLERVVQTIERLQQTEQKLSMMLKQTDDDSKNSAAETLTIAAKVKRGPGRPSKPK